MVTIGQLIWDDWNVGHIARHDVVAEVEQVCHGVPMVSETYAGRLRVLGPSAPGRMLTGVLARLGDDIYYVVAARSMSKKERRIDETESDGAR